MSFLFSVLTLPCVCFSFPNSAFHVILRPTTLWYQHTKFRQPIQLYLCWGWPAEVTNLSRLLGQMMSCSRQASQSLKQQLSWLTCLPRRSLSDCLAIFCLENINKSYIFPFTILPLLPHFVCHLVKIKKVTTILIAISLKSNKSTNVSFLPRRVVWHNCIITEYPLSSKRI